MAPRNNRVNPETATRSPSWSFLNSLDNFYTPQRDTRKEQAFQQGINAFSGILENKANENRQERRQNEFTQGQADAMREEAGQEMRGVQTGSIFRQHSKFYMMGLNETRGKAAAARFKSDLTLAYNEWDGRNTDDDGSAFREWMNGQISTFLGTLGDNQNALNGALPVINEVATNFASHHTTFTADRLQNESFQAYDEIVSGVFTDLANGDVDMETAVDRITGEANDMYNSDGAAANDRVVEAAIRYANIHNDPDSILVLARAHDSGKLPLSQSNREKLADAMDAVEADIQRETSRSNAQATAEQKAQREASLIQWGQTLQDDPYAELPRFDEVGDSTTYRNMVTLQEAFIKGAGTNNPAATNLQRMALEADLFAASTTAEKISVLTEFTQSNPSALSGADVTRYSKSIFASADPGSLVNDPTITKFRDGFGKTLAEFQLGDGFDVNRSSFLRTRGELLYNEYLMSQAGQVDMNDPRAIHDVTQAAQDYAMESLSYEYPEVLREKNDQSPLGSSLGVDDALATRDEAVATQAAQTYTDMLNAESVASDTAKALADTKATGAEDAPQVQQEATSSTIETEGTPFEDPDMPDDQVYSPVREGFYGELIHRFTDGEDTRISGAVAAIEQDPEFKSGVQRLADKYGVHMNALLAIMQFETGGSFDTGQRNAAGSGATGLIQFMPSTARSLGTTTEALASMSRTEQLVYVEKYFDQFAGRIQGGSVDDLYMAVLYPRAIGKEDGYALFSEGTTAYRQNAGLDTNHDGRVTKFEAASRVKSIFHGY